MTIFILKIVFIDYEDMRHINNDIYLLENIIKILQ